MRRLLVSSLSMLLITGSSVLAADENTTPATKSSALTIVLPVLAEAQQTAAVGSSIGTAAGASVIKPAPATRPLALSALYATAVGLQAFDVYSTLSALHLGGVEQNPLMKGVVESPAALVATKTTVTVASIAAAERLWRNNHRMGAISLMVASNVMMGIVASHNASALSSLK